MDSYPKKVDTKPVGFDLALGASPVEACPGAPPGRPNERAVAWAGWLRSRSDLNMDMDPYWARNYL